MKQGHFFMVFLFIACSCFVALYVVQKKYDAVTKEKQRMESILLQALEDTGNKCKIVIKEDEEKKKQMMEAAFSDAFSSFLGRDIVLEEKDFWRIYIPMLILVEEDGAFFYHLQADAKELRHIWTDKIFFNFPEECNDTKKKALMADILEQKASEIISEHNIIASQYGMNYRFYLPMFFQDSHRIPEFPMLFVVFQGWPLDTSGTSFYNACIDAGIFLRPNKKSEPEPLKIIE